LFFSLVFLLVILALMSLYSPSYNSYLHGCVHSHKGTIITANLYSIAYNYASAGGNAQSLIKLNEYDLQRAHYCGIYMQRSVTEEATLRADIAQSIANQDATISDLNLFTGCVNYTGFGSDYNAYYDYYNASHPEEIYLYQNGCNGNISAAADAFQTNIFNCTLLPVCQTTCGGVDEASLYQVTWDAGCHMEWAFHAHFLRALSALIIFIALNVSRYLFIWGISHLNWRSLTIGGFAFLGTATHMGNTNAHKRLVKPIAKAIKRYEREGVGYIIAAFMIHIPYIVWLGFVHSNMTVSNSTTSS